jgi:hypothetical protein
VAADDPSELGSALDELYGTAPDDFVAARTRLAADRRAAGDNAGAKVLQAARKPTTAAWALNQLRRRAPGELDAFLERSRELRAADRDTMRAALAGQRQAFNEVTDAALTILGPRANEGFRAQITATLHAATADETVAEELDRGRLVHEVTEAGFPAGDVAPAPPRRERPSRPARPVAPAPAPDDSEARAEQAQAEERAAAEARDRRRAEADAALRDAEHAADAAAAAADEAAQLVEQRQAALDDARREQRAAADRARRARREAERLAAARNRLP